MAVLQAENGKTKRHLCRIDEEFVVVEFVHGAQDPPAIVDDLARKAGS